MKKKVLIIFLAVAVIIIFLFKKQDTVPVTQNTDSTTSIPTDNPMTTLQPTAATDTTASINDGVEVIAGKSVVAFRREDDGCTHYERESTGLHNPASDIPKHVACGQGRKPCHRGHTSPRTRPSGVQTSSAYDAGASSGNPSPAETASPMAARRRRGDVIACVAQRTHGIRG